MVPTTIYNSGSNRFVVLIKMGFYLLVAIIGGVFILHAQATDGFTIISPQHQQQLSTWTHSCSGSRYERQTNLNADLHDDESSDSSNESSTIIMDEQQQSTSSSSPNNDYTPMQMLSLMGTSPRRIFLSLTASTTIALAANLFGITSNILSSLPEETAEKTKLDTFYPRGDYKRVFVKGINNKLDGISSSTTSGKCTFLIPKEWVADTSLALAQAQRQARVLDYSMTSSSSSGDNVLPDAAYGPPNTKNANGDTNVSVIVNTDVTNFSLSSSLGDDPTAAAEVLLSNQFTTNRRKRIPQLVSAFKERRGEDNVPIYQFEYTVDRGDKARPLRAISVVTGSVDGRAFVT